VLFDSPAQRDLLANFSAGGRRQGDLRAVVGDGDDPSASGSGSNVDHEDLTLGQLLDLGLLLIGRLHSEKSPQEEVVDHNLVEDGWQVADSAENLADQTVTSTQGWVDLGAHSNESAWNGVLQIVLLRK